MTYAARWLAAILVSAHVACAPAPAAVAPTPGGDASADPAAAAGSKDAGAFASAVLTPKIKVRANAPWVIAPPQSRDLVDVQRTGAQVSVTAEPRTDHADAVRRLAEITTEYADPTEVRAIGGWPAIVRRGIRKLAHPNNMPPPNPPDATVVTIAVAIDDTIVRFEATLSVGASAGVVGELVALAELLEYAMVAPPGQTERDLAQLKARPR